MSRIGVIGYGVIGKATASLFGEVAIYDPPLGYADPTVLADCEIIFLSVPIPTVDGALDFTIAHDALDAVAPVLTTDQIVAIRSTVLPGTARAMQARYPNIRFVSNPEFLRAHRAEEDMRNPDRIVIGADSPEAALRLRNLYKEWLPGNPPIFMTDTVTAELIKYAANAYLAMKISYANELYDACEKLGIDYGIVRDAVSRDPRIGGDDEGVEFSIAPTRRGFTDECLPKDLAAILPYLQNLGLPARLFQATASVNQEMLTRNLSWDLAAADAGE